MSTDRTTILGQHGDLDIIATAGIRRPDQYVVTLGEFQLGARNVLARYQQGRPVAITPLAREVGIKPAAIRAMVAAL